MKENSPFIAQDHLYNSSESSPSPFAQSLISRNYRQSQRYVVHELNSLIDIEPKGRRYSDRLKKIFITLFLLSPAAYLLLTHILPIMSLRQVQRTKSKMINSLQNKLMSLEYIPDIVREYTTNLTNEIEVILAVDSCSVTPTLSLFSNSTIETFTSKYNLTKETFDFIGCYKLSWIFFEYKK